jgi:hypothetical protein
MPRLVGLLLFAAMAALGSPSHAQTPTCQKDYELIKSPDVWNPVEAVVKAGIPQDSDGPPPTPKARIMSQIATALQAKGYGQRDVGIAVWFTGLVIGFGGPPNVPVPMQQAADRIFKTCTDLSQEIERGRRLPKQ